MEKPDVIHAIELAGAEVKKQREYISGHMYKIPAEHLSRDDFDKLIIRFGTGIMDRQYGPHKDSKFVIDNDNKYLIEQLYYYITFDKENFIGELRKGIILTGPYGTGKSVLIRAFRYILNWYFAPMYGYVGMYDNDKIIQERPVSFWKSTELIRQIIRDNGDFTIGISVKNPMVIDELGLEPVVANVFGTQMLPIVELLLNRYDNGLLTFGTSNLNKHDLGERYGGMISDRLGIMFNFFEMIGPSRRK